VLSFFRLDLRSLAALRVALGFILFYDLLTFLPMAEFYLSDQGFVTRLDFLKEQANPWNWSILYITGSSYFLYAFLGWHFVTLLLFIVGYKTRWQTFFIWIQIVSLHNRNWVVLNGGDELVRCCFILLIFLPLGAIYSWDQYHKKNDSPPTMLVTNSFFNLAIFLQLSIMYVSSAIFKNHPIWNRDYSALHYALNLDLFVRPAGLWLRNQDLLIQPLTAFAYYFELFAPLLIILGIIRPLWNFSRYLLVISFITFHLFIDTILSVGTFPYFAIAIWLAFLPSHFWENCKIDHQVYRFFRKIHQFLKQGKILSLHFFHKTIFLRRILFNTLAVFFIVNLLYWPLKDKNFRFDVGQKYYPSFFQQTNRWLATYQDWHLFAPFPKIDNLWMEVTGTLNDGTKVDLYRLKSKDNKLSAKEVQTYYSVEKWRKIFLKLENSKIHQDWLSDYYCKEWQKLSKGQFDNQSLKLVTINAYHQITQGRGFASEARKEQLVSSYVCP